MDVTVGDRLTRVVRSLAQRASQAVLAAALVAVALVAIGPLTGTYRVLTVLTGSMAPGMPVGSVAVVRPVEPASVKVGDVITYQAPLADHRVVTHRVVAVLESGPHPVLRTKGDANISPDPWTARLVGAPAWRRVAVLPFAGTAIRALRSKLLHRLTIQLVPLLLLLAMLAAIWFPGSGGRSTRRRRKRRRAVAAAVTVVAVVGLPAAMATFTNTKTASASVGSANDYMPPSVSSTVIAKQTGYLAGAIKQGGTYYVYANDADSGNPAVGISTVKTDVSAVTTGSTAVTLTAGSYSINGVSYNYRSGALTANGSLSGSKSYTISSTDALAQAQTQSGYSVTVDNTPPTAADVQTANHAGGTAGTAEIGDTLTYTFSEQIDPQSILAGWTGSSTNVIVDLEDGGCLLNILIPICADDTIEIYNGGSVLSTLGSIDMNDGGYTGGGLIGTAPDTLFGATGTASTMVQSGNSIVITLGTRSGTAPDNGGSTLMDWHPATSPYDAAGNAASGTVRSETGSNNKEF
jgi:signal peptidase I